jgi:hypothetical protein
LYSAVVKAPSALPSALVEDLAQRRHGRGLGLGQFAVLVEIDIGPALLLGRRCRSGIGRCSGLRGGRRSLCCGRIRRLRECQRRRQRCKQGKDTIMGLREGLNWFMHVLRIGKCVGADRHALRPHDRTMPTPA